MNLGNNILRLRKENKLSQEELAEKVNVTRQTISNWELASTQPTPEQLKVLSKIFNISVDELLDNDINNSMMKKVNNTEKLAGIIIKILKVIGIGFLALLVIDIISLIIFTTVKGVPETGTVVEEATINCTLDNNDYLITVGSDAYFNCSNCSKDIQNDIKNLIDYNDIDSSIESIEKYFNNNNGLCE